MIKRKVITTLLAIPLSLFVIIGLFFGEWERPIELIVMTGTVGLWLSPFFLLYGVPVTFLSEYVTRRLTGGARTLTAFLVHLFFGILFGLVAPMGGELSLLGIEIGLITVSASLTALFFWGIDELLRRKRFG